MEARGLAPDDFAAYVATHGQRLGDACQDLTGNLPLAEALCRDLLATVALRWWWLRRRGSGAASAYLRRLIRRESRSWPTEPDRPRRRIDLAQQVAQAGVAQAGHAAATGAPDPSAARLAVQAWTRAGQLRARRRLAAVVAVVAVGCVMAVGPRTPDAGPPDLPDPGPTAMPADVLILPPFADLLSLPQRSTSLPMRINVDPAVAKPLAGASVARALAAIRHQSGVLLVVAGDGVTYRVDDDALVDARMLSTSLSPDGERVAMLTTDSLLVVQVDTGQVRSLDGGLLRPGAQTLVWRTARSVLVRAAAGTRQVNVDTGAITELSTISGPDVVATRGPAAGQLNELTASTTTVGLPPRIRIWRTAPGPTTTATPASPTPGASLSPGASPSPGATQDVEDRMIVGPPWMGDWEGVGWTNGAIFARGCSTRELLLPAAVGTAHSAITAIASNGLHTATLATVNLTTMEILGFLDAQTVLLNVGTAAASAIIAWHPGTDTLQRVSTIDGFVLASLSDLLSQP